MDVIEWLGGELSDEAMVDVNEIGQLGLLGWVCRCGCGCKEQFLL